VVVVVDRAEGTADLQASSGLLTRGVGRLGAGRRDGPEEPRPRGPIGYVRAALVVVAQPTCTLHMAERLGSSRASRFRATVVSMATHDEVAQALLDRIEALVGNPNSSPSVILKLAESWAWLNSPSQPHGGGGE